MTLQLILTSGNLQSPHQIFVIATWLCVSFDKKEVGVGFVLDYLFLSLIFDVVKSSEVIHNKDEKF